MMSEDASEELTLAEDVSEVDEEELSVVERVARRKQEAARAKAEARKRPNARKANAAKKSVTVDKNEAKRSEGKAAERVTGAERNSGNTSSGSGFKKIGDFILRNQKFFYPLLALVLAAVMVVVILNLNKKRDKDNQVSGPSVSVNDPVVNVDDLSVPLETNSDELVRKLMDDYFGCLSDGDSDKLASLCDIVDESDLLRFEEQSKYLNYSINEVYTQDGPEAGTYVTYVYSYVVFDKYPELNFPAYKGFYIKKDEAGNMYIVNGELTEAENSYIEAVQNQADVIELINKVNVEYNEVVLENQYILDYLVELDSVVSTAVGERLAELNASAPSDGENNVSDGTEVADVPLENVTIRAKATTSVNVRKSDSAESDRLGEVAGGTILEVVETQVNGWTKVIYEGQEAFIKSEFLMLIKSAEGVNTIGMMTALDNVNVRSEANTDSDILGALVKGAQYEIAAVENGWVTIKFDGILAHVSAEYCDCTLF